MSERKVFHDSVTALPTQTGFTPDGLLVQATKPEHRSESMNILFSLALPADEQAELEAKVANGETISPQDLELKYAPKAADVDALKKWLAGQSFSHIEVSKDGSGIYAQAPVDQIEKSLAVHMVRVTNGGNSFTAAQNAPSLPADVGAPVNAIIGLQPFRHAHKHRALKGARSGNRVSLGETDGVAPTPNIANAPPYLVHEILKAYNADGLKVTGAGQTIGILIDTVPADKDVHAFWLKNGIEAKAGRVEKINVTGVQLPAIEGEETLDVEWSSGVASGAKIKVYASGSLSFVDLDKALDRILADAKTDKSLRQVSISLGLGEKFFGGANGEVATQHQKFLKLAALGVNVFVSSGDSGSNPDQTGHGSTGPLQPEYEASDPCVIGVGGTSLRIGASGQVTNETAWDGSGGGKSSFFAKPTWQRGAGVPAGKHRMVPDVSLAADPETGAFVMLHGKVEQIGGTSWSAPVWAAFCALINEARLKANKPTLPFLNPLLYPLAGTACFRDITDGSNGAYDCASGYDLVTGLGVPNVAKLIEALTK
jgi:kumamolisin